MTIRCIACNRPMTKAAVSIERGGLVGSYGPKCAARAGLLKPLPGFTPKKSKGPRATKARPDDAQMALDLETE